jgi:hypothetical protein
MSQRLISLNWDLQQLREEGYDVHAKGAFLIIRNVPYVNAQREVRLGP